MADWKIAGGNNRQLDLLAYQLKGKAQFHIEVGVTHRENWCPTVEELGTKFEKKFFGAPPERQGRVDGTTDFEKGKSYFSQIEAAYAAIGFRPAEVKRVWVCWIVRDQEEDSRPISLRYHSRHLNRDFDIEILSLRDFVIPELQDAIGTANYDDEVLRILGFIKQRELQSAVASGPPPVTEGGKGKPRH